MAIALLSAPAVFGKSTYITNGVLTNGDPFSAEADFTMGSNFIQLTLTNLIVNPQDISQNIDGISFVLPGTFATNSISTTSFTGTDRAGIVVNAPGGWSDSTASVNPWIVTNRENRFKLTDVGIPGTPYSIIGAPSSANGYSQANGTLVGNTPQAPFLDVTATWVFYVPGVSAIDESRLTNVVLSFGASNVFYAVAWDPPAPADTTPEPVSLALVGTGLLLIVLRRKLVR